MKTGWIFCAVASLLAPLQVHAQNDSLTPRKGWRLRVSANQVNALVDGKRASALQGLVSDRGKSWPAKIPKKAELFLSLPSAQKHTLLVVAELRAKNKKPVEVALSGRRYKRWEAIETRSVSPQHRLARKGPRRVHLTVPAGKYIAVKLTLMGAKLERLRLYRLDPKGRNDYWLFLGASITKGAIDPDAFEAALRKQFAGFEPYVVNEAVVGWAGPSLLKALPGILQEHKHARFVPIHIGGNNVSSRRPYPGGAQTLRQDLEKILKIVVASGKIPILCRLSFRAYKAKGSKPAVPPEQNGSGPYVLNVFDPLIQKYSPRFYDTKKKRGVVDLYSHFYAHPEQLSSDGVHLRRKGNESWRRLWLQHAGTIVYSAN